MAVQRAYIGLGANLGDAHATLEAACAGLAQLPQSRWLRRSPWYRSAPVDAGGPDFLNAVVELDTELAPLALLDALQALEQQHGRERPYRNAPRTLDLDLLMLGSVVLVSDRLTLPHLRVAERAFVLLPLLDLLPALQWPGVPDLPAHAQALAAQQGIERLP
jgi:2-amino-4-hydroxy-6-hydroxymethyldihydropteridine diphosphokinase